MVCPTDIFYSDMFQIFGRNHYLFRTNVINLIIYIIHYEAHVPINFIICICPGLSTVMKQENFSSMNICFALIPVNLMQANISLRLEPSLQLKQVYEISKSI